MKILHVYYGFQMGGAENITLTLIQNSPEVSHIVLILGRKGEYQEFCEQQYGINFINLNWSRRGILRWKNWKSLHQKINEISPDLIQTNMYDASLYGRVIAFILGVPVVMFVANTYNKKKHIRGFVNSILGIFTKKIIVCSDDVKKDVLRYDKISNRKIVVIPSFTKLDYVPDLTGQVRASLGLSSADYLGLFIARLVPQKGIEYLIQAIELCVYKHGLHDIKFVLVGDGLLSQDLRNMINSKNLNQYFFLVGEKLKLNPYLTEADFYVDSSLFSGLSLAAIKAMEAGLPMIMTDVGGAKMLLNNGDYGYLCPSANADALAQKILMLHRSKPPRNSKAMMHIQEKYSDKSLSLKMIETYREAINSYE